MFGNQFPDASGTGQHNDHRGHHGSNHNRNLIGHPNGRDDRVEGENNIKEKDLNQKLDFKGFPVALSFDQFLMMFISFYFGMNFKCGLSNKKNTSQDKDDISSTYRVIKEGKKRGGESHNPGNRKEQPDT